MGTPGAFPGLSTDPIDAILAWLSPADREKLRSRLSVGERSLPGPAKPAEGSAPKRKRRQA